MKYKQLHFDLIENAKDSLRHAIECLSSYEHISNVALKRAIVSSAHCLELLLKERIRRLHTAFVWENGPAGAFERKPTVGHPRKSLHFRAVWIFAHI